MKYELGRMFKKKKLKKNFFLSGINDKYMSDRWNKQKKKTRKIAFMMIYGDLLGLLH